MDTLNNKERYYQCIKCGNIHRVNIEKTFDLGDDIYYAAVCPECREMRKHLFVGKSEDEKYLYYDVTLDSRYY